MNSRRDFLTGAGAGLAGGLAAGFGAGRHAEAHRLPPMHKVSYAQAGEDLVIDFLFEYLGRPLKTYLDVGAYHPVIISNTYYFYRRGARGVLVEPNADLIPLLRQERPGDTAVQVGVGVGTVAEANFYVMSNAGYSTFSKEEVGHYERQNQGKVFVTEVRKVPLVTINDLIARYFDAAPNFVNLECEGFNLEVLKTFDFGRYRPEVFCVETLVADTTRFQPEVDELMHAKGYVARGGSLPNTIYVDRQFLDSHTPAKGQPR